jgi:hypothetical protein
MKKDFFAKIGPSHTPWQGLGPQVHSKSDDAKCMTDTQFRSVGPKISIMVYKIMVYHYIYELMLYFPVS